MSRSLPFEDAAIERQTALIRYAEGQAKTINPVLLAIIDYLTTRIPKEGELITTKKDLDQLIKDVTASDWIRSLPVGRMVSSCQCSKM